MKRKKFFLVTVIIIISSCGSSSTDNQINKDISDTLKENISGYDIFFDAVSPESEEETVPVLGDFGFPCTQNSDCESGFCVEGYNGFICTQKCTDQCPKGFSCVGVLVSPDVVFLCLPVFSKLCQPCKDDLQCSGGKCMDLQGEKFCSNSCENENCPGTYECKDVYLEQNYKLCVPKTGSCECDKNSIGLERSCKVISGMELCYGIEICGEHGWGNCVLPDEICDSKDNDCDGKTDEGFLNLQTGKYDTDKACGICGNNCSVLNFNNAEGVCDKNKTVPDCTMKCLKDYFDVNKNPSDGCECKFQSSEDIPDGTDQNCDGVDGEILNAVFVNKNGNDANTGTIDDPLITVQAAVDLADSQSLRDVYVATGVYEESVMLKSGVSVYGGYSSDFFVRNRILYETVIMGSSPYADKPGTVNAKEINAAEETRFDGFTVFGVNNKKETGNTYAVWIKDCVSSLHITNNRIIAGDAGNGNFGMDGEGGDHGNAGTKGLDAKDIGKNTCSASDLNAGGSGGTKTCQGINISGGDGGTAVCPDYDEDGTQPKSSPYKQTQKTEESGKKGAGLTGGSGGAAGYDAIIYDGSDSECGICNPPRKKAGDPFLPSAGEYGIDGSDGMSGSGGQGCDKPDGEVISGLWSGMKGEIGADGEPGSGGGGGGAAGGVETINCSTYTMVKYPDIGGSGGGGGSGGCGATGGYGGTGGGGSFSVFVSFTNQSDNVPEIKGNTIETGNGGHGGDGGNGGVGGLEGDGMPGGASGDTTIDAWCADQGGRGGQGGNGGHGGGGGGGCGGVSYGIFVWNADAGSLYKSPENSFVLSGQGGKGGSGGSSLGNNGNKGADGKSGATNF
jgi:hypothetical protein